MWTVILCVCPGSGLWVCEESVVQHQDSEADPGGVYVSAEDVLEGSAPLY